MIVPVLLLVTVSCVPRYAPTWLPPTSNGLTIQVAPGTSGSIFFETDGRRGADFSLSLDGPTSEWRLLGMSTPGEFDVERLKGEVDESGLLIGLPVDILDGVSGMWSVMRQDVKVNGVVAPRSYNPSRR